MRSITSLFFAFFAFFFLSCAHPRKPVKNVSEKNRLSTIYYAKGFSITKEGHQQVVTVFDPWHKGKIWATYHLTQGVAHKGEIHVPMDSIAIFSATQLNAIEKLNKLDAVIGVSDARYLRNASVVRLLSKGKIVEMAQAGAYYTEKLLQTPPRAIFYSPYENSRQLPAVLHRLLFIPYLDYMETDPLGRTEWIKFTAAFLGKGPVADVLFDSIAHQYNRLKLLAKSALPKPTVFSDKYYNGQSFVAGGKSYIATLFKDAGSDYVFQYLPQSASRPLGFETVWKRAQNADFWRIVGTFGAKPSYRLIADENRLYTGFKAFKEKHILYCDPQKTAYFERSPLAPQIVLSDFIKAFHPQLLPDYKPVFYHLIKN